MNLNSIREMQKNFRNYAFYLIFPYTHCCCCFKKKTPLNHDDDDTLCKNRSKSNFEDIQIASIYFKLSDRIVFSSYKAQKVRTSLMKDNKWQ